MSKKCPKTFDGKHIWRKGEVGRPLKLFGLTFLSILVGKPVLEITVCQACGFMKRK